MTDICLFYFICLHLLRFVFGQDPPCACIEIGNSCDFANRFKPEDGNKNRENVALGKKTQLSTTFGAFRPGYGAYLNKQGCLAVNGNRNFNQIYYYDDNARANCIHSGEFDSSPWWSLDLLESYSILNIVIYSRIGYEDRMVNVTITVDGRICNKFTQTPQAVTNLNCTTPLTGRFINVSKSGPIDKLQVHTLNICEVEVWVCRNGYYGDDCSLKCGACDNSTRCLSDGSCVNGCEEGWQGDKCTEACPGGYYGKGCTLKCNACENVKCHINGTCLAGCEEGWKGDMCTEAVRGQAAGESCGSNSTCNATLVCESNICKLQIGGACNSSGQCLNGSSCQGSVCKIQAGAACNSSNSGMCFSGTTCQDSICRKPRQPFVANESKSTGTILAITMETIAIVLGSKAALFFVCSPPDLYLPFNGIFDFLGEICLLFSDIHRNCVRLLLGKIRCVL